MVGYGSAERVVGARLDEQVQVVGADPDQIPSKRGHLTEDRLHADPAAPVRHRAHDGEFCGGMPASEGIVGHATGEVED